LRIHELRVEFETLTLVRCQQGGKVELHSHSPVGSGCNQRTCHATGGHDP
jgi:hypothetical protein